MHRSRSAGWNPGHVLPGVPRDWPGGGALLPQRALRLRDLNDLFESLSQEQLTYLDGQLADWYGQIVPVVLMPDGYPALQVDLSCTHCNHFARTVYAVAGEHGAWTTLLDAASAFLADLCDADARVQVLSCADVALQAQLEAGVNDGE